MTITREQALAWAREAGFSMIGGVTNYADVSSLEYFAELVEQHVRRETQPEPQPAAPQAPVARLANAVRELLAEALERSHIPYGASHEDVADVKDWEQRLRSALGQKGASDD